MNVVFVTQHGARGDVQSDTCSINKLTPTILTITSPKFTKDDEHKPILVAGAGSEMYSGPECSKSTQSQRGPLYTTIKAFISPTEIELAHPADASAFGNPGVLTSEVRWGTDDTQAFSEAALAVGNGDELHIPAGIYWIFPDSYVGPPLGAGAGVAVFSGLTGVRVVGDIGATLLTARPMSIFQRFDLFSFENCSDVEVAGLEVRGHQWVGIGEDIVQNAVLVHLYGGCRNVRVTANCRGITAPLMVTAGPPVAVTVGSHGETIGDVTVDSTSASDYAGVDAQRSHGIRFGGKAINCGYGAGFQFSGDDVKGTLVTDGCYRSYFACGVSDHWMNIDSRNYQGVDVLLQCFGGRSGPGMPPSGYGVQNITIDYTNRETDKDWCCGSAAVELEFAANAEGVHHNILVRYDVRYNPLAVFGPVLRVNNSSPAADDPMVPFNGVHKVERLRLEGRVEALGNPFDFNFSAHKAGGKVELHDLVMENLTLLGTQPPNLNLTRLIDLVEFRNMVCDTNVSVQTAGSARAWWVRCRAPAVSSTGSSVPADYVDCFIGAYHHAAKYCKGDLSTNWIDAFRVRHLGTAAAYRLHYYVAEEAGQSGSGQREEIFGSATWSAIMGAASSPVYSVELPVHQVRRRLGEPVWLGWLIALISEWLNIKIQPIVEVQLVRGNNEDFGTLQLRVPGWTNAQAAFHLEVLGLPVQDVSPVPDV